MRTYSDFPSDIPLRTWAEIDMGALVGNYRALASCAEETGSEPIAVLKAEAYGHGAEICAEAFLREGCRFFAVACLEEAIAMRNFCTDLGAKPKLLILGYTDPQAAPLLVKYDLITACVSKEHGIALAESAPCGERVRVHLKLNTGMNRIGFPAQCDDDAEETAAAVREIREKGGVSIEGAFTHFYKADDPSDEGRLATHRQAERFFKACEKIRALGTELPYVHLCNSAGTVRYPEYHADGCRLGISLYDGAEPCAERPIGLAPVMRLKTKITQVHALRPGESVSYGGEYFADVPRVIASLGVGYADGYMRVYRGAKVAVVGEDGELKGYAPVVGRICMDQCMIDVTDVGTVKAGDVAVLIGYGDQLADLARRAHTINHECLNAVSARVLRIPV